VARPVPDDLSEQQFTDAMRYNAERARQTAALRRAGAELARLFPHLAQQAPGTEVDPARIQEAVAGLAVGAETRRGTAASRPRPPTAHDAALQAARMTGGPAGRDQGSVLMQLLSH
jgi:hypothetical protein